MLLVYSLNSYTQELQLPKNVQSPNSANLGKYGDVPVSYYTGTPVVRIPLQTVSERGIDIPIALNYDASGIRLQSQPGWVGQNWSLSAGGVITRTVRDEPDECRKVGGSKEVVGFMSKGSDLCLSTVDNEGKLKDMAINSWGKGYDYEPDIFTFNFLGKTGKFFMGNDGAWKVSSDENLQIIFEENQLIIPRYESLPVDNNAKYPKVIGGFKIRDDQGITYEFGYNLDAIEFGIDFFGQVYNGSLWKSNAWYLTKIFDKYGNEVFNLTYKRGGYVAQFFRTTGLSVIGFNGNGFNPTCYNSSSVNESLDIEGELISPVYLSSITSTNNNIIFKNSISDGLTYNPQDINEKVNKLMNIYNGCETNPLYYLGKPTTATEVINTMKFNKLDEICFGNQHFIFTYNNNPNERLNLLKLDIYGENYHYEPTIAQKHSYTFTYNQFGLLPGYLSKKIDHWGYYNGKDYIINTSDLAKYQDQRMPNADYLQIGTLSSMKYPTGGGVAFDYEPHKYGQYVTDDHLALKTESNIAGGLRVRKITINDGVKTSSKTYKYINNYETNVDSLNSSGVLAAKPKYYWQNWQVKRNSGTYSQNVFSVNSIIPLSNFFGSHIGYSKVEEIREDGSYTIYEYSNYGIDSSYYDSSPIYSLNTGPSPYDQYSDLSITRGKLLKVKVYNASNALLQEREFKYRTDLNDLLTNNQFFIVGTNASFQNVCSDVGVSLYKGTAYKTFFFDYDVVEEKTTNYLNGNAIIEKTQLTKQDYLLSNTNIRLTKQVIKDCSDGQQTMYYSYPSDLQSEPNIANLIVKFRVGEVIQTTKFKNERPIGTTKTTYKIENNICVPDILYTSNTDETALKPEVFYDKHDMYGNILQYHSLDGIYHSIYWGYNQTYPLLFGTNIQYDIMSNKIVDPNIRDIFTNAVFTSYEYSTFSPKVITKITDPIKQSQFFIYDLHGRLESILDNNKQIIKHYNYNYANQH